MAIDAVESRIVRCQHVIWDSCGYGVYALLKELDALLLCLTTVLRIAVILSCFIFYILLFHNNQHISIEKLQSQKLRNKSQISHNGALSSYRPLLHLQLSRFPSRLQNTMESFRPLLLSRISFRLSRLTTPEKQTSNPKIRDTRMTK